VKAVLRLRKEPYYRRAAFEAGLKRVGFVLTEMNEPNGPEDWRVVWNRQGTEERACDKWEAAGGTVIVAENGYLQQVDKTYYAISVHGHNGSGWFPVGNENRFLKTGFHIQPEKPIVGSVLVIGQRGIGSHAMKSPPQWGEQTLKAIQKLTKFPAVLRPHPGNFAPRVPLVCDLAKAAQCVIWSSAAGVRALVEGLTVFYAAPRWICEEGAYSFKDIPKVIDQSNLGRLSALHTMSHGQWHHDEITTGEPFARIIAQRSRAVW